MNANFEVAGATALVTGASRRFGRGIATALSGAGAQVVGVARDRGPLEDLHAELGESFTAVSADAADPTVAGQLIDTCRPAILVLNAAPPRCRGGPAPHVADVQPQLGHRRSARVPLDARGAARPACPGSVVITLSSGAALRGSPLSGGYAGAKATIRFISSYVADESGREALGIRFVSVLPQLTPATALGGVYVAAYAARQGMDTAAFLEASGPALTAEQAGKAIVDLTGPGYDQDAYLLTATGLSPVA
jgi:NADP-dependent 3-hydroxy acid dehydrogenase YdfG